MKARPPLKAAVAALCVIVVGCQREARPFRKLREVAGRPPGETQPFMAGGGMPAGSESPFQRNAWGISEGKRLFAAYNCTGCHLNGGGGIGPPLMDDQWIYGFQAANIYSTVVEGRPNGMPSFRNKIPDYQVWQLVAYIQAMSGQVPIDALPGRDEHMQVRRAEPITPYQGRIQTGHR